ncbi:primosomal protein N' [Gammaproteobacteria bacterium 45_16_T64]|nr:primosomal protein N' [Gammaproteobacteria bacterium 45_16_T64]
MTDSHNILRVAIPGPLRKYFDYLPASHPAPEQQLPGMRVLVPFGRRQVVGVITHIVQHSDVLTTKLKRVHRLLDNEPSLSPSILALCKWAIKYYHHSPGEVLQNALPLALRSEKGSQDTTETIWKQTTKGRLIPLSQLSRSPKQSEALTLLREHPTGLSQAFLTGLDIKTPILNALKTKGLCESQQQSQTQDSLLWNTDSIRKEAQLPLNKEQTVAVEQVLSPTNDAFSAYLLDGVTGSGKTEVYLHILDHVLHAGKQAIVLVPEIGLTPQTIKRFEQRFMVPIFSIHSNLTANQRLAVWRKAKNGTAAIIIGTRSALFTPLLNPGIIIVDEEHDPSYKQQDGFRYSARDMAVVRAKLEKIPALLGSATPSFESLHNVKEGRYSLLRLTERAGNATLPQFKVSDMRQAELKHGLCKSLIGNIRTELDKGNQVLYFLNRRGYSPLLMCHDCGWNSSCIKCDARMTFHQHPKHLHCHHCNYQTRIPVHCPDCHSADLRPIGQGTERIDENLSALFPDARIIRIDRDTTRKKQSLEAHLKQINSGEPCILIGTQMLAKGHHFPHVTLVAIADIDSGLFAADFRATEHTAQLILQVAGRAGRAEKKGRVVLQSHNPEHHVLLSLTQQNYGSFAKHALTERKLTGLPPYGHIAMFRAEANNESIVIQFLQDILETFQQRPTPKVDAWGPVPAIMTRRAGYYRYQLMVRSDERGPLHQALTGILSSIDNNPHIRKVRWHLDIDPSQTD